YGWGGMTTTAQAAEIVPDFVQQNYFEVSGQWVYTLVHKVVVANHNDVAAREIDIRVPLMDQHTPIYLEQMAEQLDPYPQRFDFDESGRRYGIYHIGSLAPGESRVFYQKYGVKISSIRYDVNSSGGAYAYDQVSPLSLYLLPEQDIQSDDAAISAYVKTVIGTETNPYTVARLLFAAVNLRLSYSEQQQAQDGISVLNRGIANCEGYTNLLVALLRAAGIPARCQSGYLFQPDSQVASLPVDPRNGWLQIDKLRHTWLEFYLPNTGWMICDPTFTYVFTIDGVANKFVDWSYFAHIPDSRRYIYFREGSGSEDKIDYSAIGSEINIDFTAHLLFGKQTLPFNDIEHHWAKDAVVYGVEKGYFSGVSVAAFAPDRAMTRGMFVTALGRMYEAAGGAIASVSRNNSFTDVQADDYFAKYVSWAVQNGVAQGYRDNYFGANDAVNREQMAKIITDYLHFYGRQQGIAPSIPGEIDKILAVYTDRQQIQNWAAPGIAFCTQSALLTGMPGGKFAPDANATRGQVAAILQRVDAYVQNQ
ncbi:MAG: S-layer homology domain-containing protein, partial [Clostridiales bacterium]